MTTAFWIHNVEYIEAEPVTKKEFEKYINKIIATLDENVYKAFNLPKKDLDSNFFFRNSRDDTIYIDREYNVLCSPQFVLENVCHELHKSNIMPKLKCIYAFNWNLRNTWENTAMYNLLLHVEWMSFD